MAHLHLEACWPTLRYEPCRLGNMGRMRALTLLQQLVLVEDARPRFVRSWPAGSVSVLRDAPQRDSLRLLLGLVQLAANMLDSPRLVEGTLLIGAKVNRTTDNRQSRLLVQFGLQGEGNDESGGANGDIGVR